MVAKFRLSRLQVRDVDPWPGRVRTNAYSKAAEQRHRQERETENRHCDTASSEYSSVHERGNIL